jgi:hypothetical protein
MFDLRLWTMGLFASSTLVLAAPVPGGCGSFPGGTGGVGGTPATCGNGNVDYDRGEDCDGETIGTCENSGNYVGGTLKCGADCRNDTSQCIPAVCGDGRIEANEDCEGADLGFRSSLCVDHATQANWYLEGTVHCGSNCEYDYAGCRRTVCGDGKIEGLEQCEGANMGQYTGKTCQQIQPVYLAGVPSCSATCMLDYAACFPHFCVPGRLGPVCY